MILELICAGLLAYYIILFARIILSWTTTVWSPPAGLSPVIRVVYDLTEPVLAVFRRYIPPIGAIDISALFVFIILGIVRRSLNC